MPFQTLRLPIIAAPMFLVSGPELVIAQCKAGIIGTLPALNARETSVFADWLDEIREAVGDAPFGVNLIAAATNRRFEADLAVCIDRHVPLIITSLRAPDGMSGAIGAYGGIHIHDVVTVRHAEKALECGVHGLVLVTAGAGGHGGQLTPMAFIPEVRRFFDGLIALGGGIADGRSLLAARVLGADFGYIGTRFIAAKESLADDDYRQMVIAATARDIVYTPYFSGVGANYLAPSIVRAGFDLDELPKGALLAKDTPKPNGARAWSDIRGAGQGVGATRSIETVAEIVGSIEAEYQAVRAAV